MKGRPSTAGGGGIRAGFPEEGAAPRDNSQVCGWTGIQIIPTVNQDGLPGRGGDAEGYNTELVPPTVEPMRIRRASIIQVMIKVRSGQASWGRL